MTFCSNCGNKLAQASKFCTSCGTKLPILNIETEEQTKPTYPRIDTNTKKTVQPTKQIFHPNEPPTHKSFSLTPISKKPFSKQKKVLIGCLSLIILVTGYVTLDVIFEATTMTFTPENVATDKEENTTRFKSIPHLVEQNAVINEKISVDLLKELIVFTKSSGYKCDTVSSARPFMNDKGYQLNCNNYRYKYEIEDKGGNLVVTVK